MPITYGSHENVTASDIAFSIHTAVDAAFRAATEGRITPADYHQLVL